MGTVGAVLPIGLAVSLSPVPIIAVVLLLFTPRARRDGIAFVLGWVIGVAGAGGALVLAGAATDTTSAPSPWVAVAKIVLGVALVVIGALQWRRRERREQRLAELPAWMHALDHFGPVRAFGLALAFAVLNPESLLLIASGATVIVQGAAGPTQETVAFVVFVVLGTLGPALPLALYLVLGTGAEPVLSRLRRWLAGHNTAILAVMLLVIGTALLGGGIGELSP